MNSIIAYILSFAILVTVSLLPQAFGTMKNVDTPWYDCIKPKITPPRIVFPIVWSLLYFLIAIALAQVLMLPISNSRTKVLLFLFMCNLILNVVWSVLYFGNKQIIAAFIVVLGLVISQAGIMWLTYTNTQLPRWVVWIQLPYLLWLSFASVLNFMSISKATACAKI
jgi:tryptophan-rich sensory protein